MGGLLITIVLILKARTDGTRDFGKSVLFYRLVALSVFLPFFTKPIFGFSFNWIYAQNIVAIAALIFYLLKKSIVARNYVLLVLSYIFIGPVTVWLGMAIQVFLFVNDITKKTYTSDTSDKPINRK